MMIFLLWVSVSLLTESESIQVFHFGSLQRWTFHADFPRNVGDVVNIIQQFYVNVSIRCCPNSLMCRRKKELDVKMILNHVFKKNRKRFHLLDLDVLGHRVPNILFFKRKLKHHQTGENFTAATKHRNEKYTI